MPRLAPATALFGIGIFLGCSPSAQAQINRLQLGSRITGSDVAFRIWSSRATRIELCLYAAPSGSQEVERVPLDRDAATFVWSTTVPLSRIRNDLRITGSIYYGYRAWGPNWPFDPAWQKGSRAGFLSDVDADGNRFNPNKLLVDPYAREISHDPLGPDNADSTIYASGPDFFLKDSGPFAPKSLVLLPDGVNTGIKPSGALKDQVIYEAHLRGLTKTDSTIPSTLRGTYAGAALAAPRLKTLGVTAVEFLPLQETQNDFNDAAGPKANYWGYATLNYFAPDRRYSSDRSPGGPTREFKGMVAAFHAAGLKVYVDVVYNHTGEGYQRDGDPRVYNLLSFRGIDNPAYYSLTADRQFSWDNTGTGGNVNTVETATQDLIVDSLAWWRDELGVDGFRFDLASILGNTCRHGCFKFEKTNSSTALNRIARDLSGVDLIAEPWAIGAGTYQVGNFPARWSEWNDKFRDTVRRSQNKLGIEDFTPAQIVTRVSGSPDLFRDDGRRPWNSINFVTAHDGFTLADLYRFNAKNNNQAFPAGPSTGGSDSNLSWDQRGDPALQRQATRNGMALLLLSAGVPMMVAGDEFLRSLNGNNNPYNLDTAFNWLNYDREDAQQAFQQFTTRLLAFRRRHPALRPDDFYTAAQWKTLRPDGDEARADYLNNPDQHAIAWRIDGAPFRDPASSIYVAYNAWTDSVNFRLPAAARGKRWFAVMDTSSAKESQGNISAEGSERALGADGVQYRLGSRAILLAIAR